MNGIGGDLFAIVYEAKTGKLYGLNASGWAPAKLSIEFLKAKGISGKMPDHGIQSVTVPGAVDGWSQLLSRFGTKKFSEVLDPAIRYANEGFPVPEWDAAYWNGAEGGLKAEANAAAIFLVNGRAPRLGEIFRNPDLARSLELIAKDGRDGFYKGGIAQRIVATELKLGGVMSGLTRVRQLSQDDAHCFVTQDQIGEEVERLIRLVQRVYGDFDLSFTAKLSTRPDE